MFRKLFEVACLCFYALSWQRPSQPRNPVTIKDIKIVETIMEGKTVYRR